MKFGIAFSNMQRGLIDRLKILDDIVIEAEKLEYDSFFTMDHYMLPWGNETFETWVYLSYLAGKTSKIRLGTCVTPIPFRPPAILAKMVSTLDIISGGRVIVGVGLGWYQAEFEAYSSWDSNVVRFEKTKEALDIMSKLWVEEKVNFEGKYYRVKDAVLQPKPIQKPYPPLWFGGTGKKMLKLTAEKGSGLVSVGPRWAPNYVTSENYHKLTEKVKKIREKMGKTNDFTFACIMAQHENFNEFVKEIEEYKKAGMNYLILGIVRVRDGVTLLKKFRDEIVLTIT
ncbi:MAG: LLM class flavin-dependent oxidoreductase [Candidatus Bathyarchaeota archaeon]